MNQQQRTDSLAKSSKDLMLLEPMYGLFLIQLNKEWTTKIDTSAIGKNGINVMLYINEIFWESLADKWRLYVLKADVLGVVFHHIELGDNLPDKEIVCLAHNIVVTQYIDTTWLPAFDVKYEDFRYLNDELIKLLKEDLRLKRKTREEVIKELSKIPPRGVYLKDFPELNLEPKKGLEYYYHKLKEAKDKEPGKGGSQALIDLIQDRADGLPDNWFQDWSEFEGMSEAEAELMRSQIDYQLKEVAEQVKKSRGTIPGEIQELLNLINFKEPPKFDWKGYMRRFIGRSTKIYTKKSYRKFNKRFPTNPGLKIRQKKSILYFIDTSGSMSVKDDLPEAFKEIHHIHNLGIAVTIVQFDSAISNISQYRKGYEDKIVLHGRGGTNFSCAFDYINEHCTKYSAAIILTDGIAPPPDSKSKLKVLWAHTSNSEINNQLPGLKIKLNK